MDTRRTDTHCTACLGQGGAFQRAPCGASGTRYVHYAQAQTQVFHDEQAHFLNYRPRSRPAHPPLGLSHVQ
eukprot:4486662-Prymnesium_polylepis.2